MFGKSEKIKALFKMQFHATQVPDLKAKSLMIYLVPLDVGRPTVRSSKAPIIEGICTWENPLYEPVKLVKETKAGKIRQKIYYIVVSTGSSKPGFLGEVSVDFAQFADTNKPVNLILPLHNSKIGTILHVTVQKMVGEGSDSRLDYIEETAGNASCNAGNQLRQKDPSNESEQLSEITYLHNEQNGSLDEAELKNGYSETTTAMKETSYEVLKRLRAEIKMLEREVEVSGIEMQCLQKQIMKEKKALKIESERYHDSDSRKIERENDDARAKLENAICELQQQKILNKKLRLQLQEMEDSNSEYVLAIGDLTKSLDLKNTEISQLTKKLRGQQNGSKEAEFMKQIIERLESEIEFLRNEKTEKEEVYSNLEQSERERIEIERCYHELSSEVKRFELQVANLEAENERQAFQYTESLSIINKLEFLVDNLHKEMENQATLYIQDLETLNAERIELEKRTIRAEVALRKTRRRNADMIQKLQEEFKYVYLETLKTVQGHEKIAREAKEEASNMHKANKIQEKLLNKVQEELQMINGSNSENEFDTKEQEMQHTLKMQIEDLEKKLIAVRKDSERMTKENTSMKARITVKKTKEVKLHRQLKKLRAKNNNVINQLQDLNKKTSKSEGDLCMKDQEFKQIENQPERQGIFANMSSQEQKTYNILLSEVASLRDRNTSMEQELKEMHERYSEISLKFAEVEGERQQLVMSLRKSEKNSNIGQ